MRVNYKDAMFYLKLEEMKNIAENYSIIIKSGIDSYWKQLKENKCFCRDEDLDDERYMLRMFKYRMELMQICCLCETFEQFLFNLLLEKSIECENSYSTIRDKIEEEFNVDLHNNKEINEMRSLTNAIKHGEGYSFDAIREELGDDVLANSLIYDLDEFGNVKAIKQYKYDCQTLTNITLNVEGKIQQYYKVIEELWNKIHQKL